MSKLYTLKQASMMCGYTPMSLRARLNEGKLEGIKMGRDWFLTEDIVKMLWKRKAGK